MDVRIASIAYDSGFTDAITFITPGILSRGNMDPDKKKSGTTKKFVTAIKLGMSLTTAPTAELKLTIAKESMQANNKEINKAGQLCGWKPKMRAIINKTMPWITPIVAPPSAPPSMTFVLETGATRVSFKNPNCLSKRILAPQKIEVNKMVWAMTPGTMNCI